MRVALQLGISPAEVLTWDLGLVTATEEALRERAIHSGR